MNNGEARFILNAYRPSGADADDPAFAEAAARYHGVAHMTADEYAAETGRRDGRAAPATSAAAGQTQAVLNYPFTLLEIRENDEIVDPAASSQSALP